MSAKKDSKKDEPTQQEATLKAADMPVTIHSQYIRDMSFENPNAPDALRAGAAMPEMNVNISMDARTLPDEKIDNLYEVALTVSAEAKKDDETIFIAELVYGVTVSVGPEVLEEHHHPLLLIEIPKFAFPFARQILSNMTSQGGYPPLLLSPVDFQALYMDRFSKEIAEARAAAEEGQTN